MPIIPKGLQIISYREGDGPWISLGQFDPETDLPAGDLLRAAHPSYYIREIDRLLVGETNQEIIDALLDRRCELAQQIKEMGEG